MRTAAQLIVFALVLGQGHSAIDDVFRQVQEEHDDTMKSVASGLSAEAHLQSDWCRYKMKDSNRTLVKLHYDMVIDESTYKDAFRKDFKHDGVSCEIQSVDGQTANRRRRAASKSEVNRWPLEIPYQIEEGVGAHGTLTIMKAMLDWSRYTCLHFVQRTNQYDHIIFSDADRCESYVGRMIGPQYILLHPENCMTLPVILHEIGHAIGLYHEHTRADRDNNVTVNYGNIDKAFHYNFDKLFADQYLDFNKTYDYHSIMHYGKNFFANPRNAISLEPTDKGYLDIIGEAQHLSFHDVQIVNAMYNCKEKCADVECPEVSFVGKNCECFCPGPPEDPVRRCNNPKKKILVFCKAPDIDLATNWVFSIGKVELLNLAGTQYPDGTVLTVVDPRCSEAGNYTCLDGQWVANVNCRPDRCVLDRTRYNFKPNITADVVGPTNTEYVNTSKHVHVECVAPKGIPSYDTQCTDSFWVPELPNCEAAVDCRIENFDVRNVEVLFKDEVQADGDVVPDGSTVVARCKGSNQQNISTNESQSALVCYKGDLNGQIPTQCPAALYACPIVQYATTSGPFNDEYDVKCFDRYEMEPHLRAARFQCDWRGVWRPFVPKCIPELCQVIYDIAKTAVKLIDGSTIRPNSRISSGQMISLACKQPGHVPDSVTVTCDHGVYKETGDKNLPLCKPESCQVIYDNAKTGVKLIGGSNMNISPNSRISSGQTISMACKQPGHVSDHVTVTCEFGKFKETGDKKLPLCKPESCQVIYDTAKAEVKLMDGSNMNISPNSRIKSGQTISMACKQPGNVPDHLTLTCELGVYKETGGKNLPMCKLVTCKPPPLSDAVVYTPMNSSYLFKASVGIQRCKGKLWFQGNQSLTCTAGGTWNGTATCTPYCHLSTETLEERQNSVLEKHTIKNITVESYQECLTYCRNYDRILCRAFAYGFDQGRRRCHITYVDPSRHTDMVGERQLWSVWIRKCD